ncbi:D-alanyl-D-alanine carboxypeptidase family protein [Streptomyces sp. CA-111067]|uniref:D-alanyl-D-alanine carboxypeptidase family protein n=1 Tax=Streptomyces sp. CA-111067 TaxID=3240046 RepID=UPI003D959DC1
MINTIKSIRRITAALVTAGAVVAVGAFAVPAQAASAPTIVAKGGYSMDSGTGRSLFLKAWNTPLSTGSTTKIMTFRTLLSLKTFNLDTKLPFQKVYSDYIVANNASSAGLIVGDKPTVRQLVYAMMLPSGCDAAYALADHYGVGNTRDARVANFIGKMNTIAGQLKLTNTHFDSFDGIGNGNNHSTPRDLAVIAKSDMQFGAFQAVVRTKSTVQKVTTASGGYRNYTWTNTNTMLSSYSGMTGVKTGSGPEAGYCLVFSATRGNKTIIGAVLSSTNETTRTADVKKILDYSWGA